MVFLISALCPISYLICEYPKPQNWYLPISHPFNIAIPVRFYLIFVIQFVFGYILITTLVATIIFFVGFCTYIESCVEDYSTVLSRFDDECVQISSALNEAIKIHTNIIRYVYSYYANA